MVESEENCVFCKIVRGEIPCYKIYETDSVLAFLDINPYSLGHLLVIPKNHSAWVWEMDKEDYSVLMKETYYLAQVLGKAFGTEWIEEIIAGIGVSHSHIHLLPRKKDDGLGEVPTKPLSPKPSEEEMKKILEKIKKAL